MMASIQSNTGKPNEKALDKLAGRFGLWLMEQGYTTKSKPRRKERNKKMNYASSPCPECGGTLVIHPDGRKCGCLQDITHVFRYPSLAPLGQTLSRIVLRDLDDSRKTVSFMDEK